MDLRQTNHRRSVIRKGTTILAVVCNFLLLAGPAIAQQPAAVAPPQTTGSSRQSPHVAERLADLPGLSNVGRVAPGVYRGAQPGADGYESLKKLGIKTVIDLRTSESEKVQVEAAGMRAIAVPIAMTRTGLKEKVDRVVALLADPDNQPVFVHCRHGQDRTGIVVAAYRMKVDKWPLAEAEKEMQQFGFNDIWINFKKFIRKYGRELKL